MVYLTMILTLIQNCNVHNECHSYRSQVTQFIQLYIYIKLDYSDRKRYFYFSTLIPMMLRYFLILLFLGYYTRTLISKEEGENSAVNMIFMIVFYEKNDLYRLDLKWL